MKHLLRNNSGFTLIEVMVGMAMVSTMAFFGMNYVTTQISARKIRTQQTINRFLAIQTSQQVSVHMGFYPPIASDTGKAIYAGCFDRKGNLIVNIKNNRDFQFMVLPIFDELKPSGICDPVKTAYESRFYWQDPAQFVVMINILATQSSAKRLTSQNFKIYAK
jgi:prepilin-type N-terminal cleavage/methylation domain-containing protein